MAAQVKQEYGVKGAGEPVTIDAALRHPTTSSIRRELGGATFPADQTVGHAIAHFRARISVEMGYKSDDFAITAYRYDQKEADPTFLLSHLEFKRVEFQTKQRADNAPKRNERTDWKRKYEQMEKQYTEKEKELEKERNARIVAEEKKDELEHLLQQAGRTPSSPASASTASTAHPHSPYTPSPVSSRSSSRYRPYPPSLSPGTFPAPAPQSSPTIHVNAPSTSTSAAVGSHSHRDDSSFRIGARAQVGNAGHGSRGVFTSQPGAADEPGRAAPQQQQQHERIRQQCDVLRDKVGQVDDETELDRIETWMADTIRV